MTSRREEYLLEPLRADVAFGGRWAIARCAARWADRYEAWLLEEPPRRRGGRLSQGEGATERLLEELFAWADAAQAQLRGALGLVLYRDDAFVYGQGEGTPYRLLLTPEEFAQFQGCCAAQGLPRDVFYPQREQRRVVEPGVVPEGGVVRGEMVYSPLMWAARDAAAIARLRVPSEDERRASFARAGAAFERALILRNREQNEPGRTPGPDEAREESELSLVFYILRLVQVRALGEGAAAPELVHDLRRRRARAAERFRAEVEQGGLEPRGRERLPNGTAGVYYSQQVGPVAGPAPADLAVVGGAPPPGVELVGPGLLRGTSEAAGDYAFTVAMLDAQGDERTSDYRLVVAPAPSPPDQPPGAIEPG